MAKASDGRCFWSHRRLTGGGGQSSHVFLSDGWMGALGDAGTKGR